MLIGMQNYKHRKRNYENKRKIHGFLVVKVQKLKAIGHRVDSLLTRWSRDSTVTAMINGHAVKRLRAFINVPFDSGALILPM